MAAVAVTEIYADNAIAYADHTFNEADQVRALRLFLIATPITDQICIIDLSGTLIRRLLGTMPTWTLLGSGTPLRTV